MSRFSQPQMGDAITPGFQQAMAGASRSAANIGQQQLQREAQSNSLAMTRFATLLGYQQAREDRLSAEMMHKSSLVNAAGIAADRMAHEKLLIKEQREHDLAFHNAVQAKNAEMMRMQRELEEARKKQDTKISFMQDMMHGPRHGAGGAGALPGGMGGGGMQGGMQPGGGIMGSNMPFPTSQEEVETLMGRMMPQTVTLMGNMGAPGMVSSQVNGRFFGNLLMSTVTGESPFEARSADDLATSTMGTAFSSGISALLSGEGDKAIEGIGQGFRQMHLLYGTAGFERVEGEVPDPADVGERALRNTILPGLRQELYRVARGTDFDNPELVVESIDTIFNMIMPLMAGGDDSHRVISGYTDSDGTAVPGSRDQLQKLIRYYREEEPDSKKAQAMEVALQIFGSYTEDTRSVLSRGEGVRGALLQEYMTPPQRDPETGAIIAPGQLDRTKVPKEDLALADAVHGGFVAFNEISSYLVKGLYVGHEDKKAIGRAAYEVTQSLASPEEVQASIRLIAAGDMAGALDALDASVDKTYQAMMKHGRLVDRSPEMVAGMNKELFGDAGTRESARAIVEQYAEKYSSALDGFTPKFNASGEIINFPAIPMRPPSIKDSFYGSAMLEVVEKAALTKLGKQHLTSGPSTEEQELQAQLDELVGAPLEVDIDE